MSDDAERSHVEGHDNRDPELLRGVVLAVFLELADPVAWRAYEHIRQLPGYRDLDDADALEVLSSVRWLFVTLITCLQEKRQFTGREVARLEDIGAAQARLGIPQDAAREAFSTVFVQSAEYLNAVGRDLTDHGRAGDTIVHDLMGSLGDLSNVREDGFR